MDPVDAIVAVDLVSRPLIRALDHSDLVILSDKESVSFGAQSA